MSVVRKLAMGLTVVFALGATVAWIQWLRPTREAVAIGAGMLAKQICSCVYLAGRELDACRADQPPTTDVIEAELLEDEGRVRAWVPLLGARTAVYRDGFGCTLE